MRFLYLLLLFYLPACAQPGKNILISGKITPAPGMRPTAYLVQQGTYDQLMASYFGTVVDSVAIAPDGSFVLEQKPWLKQKSICLLLVQPAGSRYVNNIETPFSKSNYLPLVLEPGGKPVQVEAQAQALTQSAKISGGNAETRQIHALFAQLAPLYTAMEAPTDSTAEFTGEHHPAQTSLDQTLEQYLDTVQAVYPTLVAMRLRAPEHDFRAFPELALRVKARLSSDAPDWSAQLARYLTPERLPVLLGEKMPDFRLPTPTGDTLSLAGVKGSLVLVDFWASWCAPCRRENREIVRPLYDRFRDKGFQVLAISIDSDRKSWQRAIEKDGATWLHAGDLMGDASPVRQSLRFEFIPNNYLLDETGRLLARNLHGEALQKFVEKYYY